jgi:phosphoglucomutase/phosphomannomutase
MNNNTIEMDAKTKQNLNNWLNGSYDEVSKSTIKKLLNDNPKEAIDAFYTNLSFGTGGLRGLMGVGTNRMNVYTVSAATQGLANYLKKQSLHTPLSVFIGYDSRHMSKEFAEASAKVLAANDIHVYLCEDIRPTPFVSFGCRHNTCSAAIMITASHNPKEYNGYKVYWNDGAQVLPPHDTGIIDEVNKISDVSQVKTTASIKNPLIEYVTTYLDNSYLQAIKGLELYPEQNEKSGNEIGVVYTSLHGTGITLIPKAFQDCGFNNISYVEKQCIPDGDFPTLKSPNPEEKAALQLGIELLEKTNSDILIATDPDADRVGVAVKHGKEVVILNGNQMACLLLNHICEALTAQKKMPERAAFIKTIVTTELFKEIVNSYEKTCFDVLTGFKYIAEKIREWETDVKNSPVYIFGAEESYGYLFGTIVRDKDAISTSTLIVEAALNLKLQGKTFIDKLHEIYKKHGCYVEDLISVKFEETKLGKEQMQKGMENIENNPPKTILGTPVLAYENYAKSIKIDLITGHEERLLLPKSDVLIFRLQDGSKLIVRPSGTEPKIKIYGGVVVKGFESLDTAFTQAKEKVKALCTALQKQLTER